MAGLEGKTATFLRNTAAYRPVIRLLCAWQERICLIHTNKSKSVSHPLL